MRAGFVYHATLKHHNFIGLADSGKPVRNHQTGTANHQLVEGLLHEVLAEVPLARRTGRPVTFGWGPRYLHSTGQYHKGGPNTCVAVVLTADDDTETPIPEAGYSFSVLKRAQALGDVQALEAHGRRVVRLHFGDHATAAEKLREIFADALR